MLLASPSPMPETRDSNGVEAVLTSTSTALTQSSTTASSERESLSERHTECNTPPDKPGGDIGADRIEAAMREIDDAHDPEDQAQPCGDEKQHRGVEQRVQDLNGEDRHQSPLWTSRRSCRKPGPALRRVTANVRDKPAA